MKISFTIKQQFPKSPMEIYDAWLNSEQHTAMTGGVATASIDVGAVFSAWDGYITGKNLELLPNQKIKQSWRTTDFQDGDEDSMLELLFTATSTGCEMTLSHSNIPEGSPDYEQGWENHYFQPMRAYFGRSVKS